MDHTPRIAIVGAGPGGLTLARVLARRGIRATVYEKEASPDGRGQGGTLDMHADSGQVALRAAGLLDEFAALARPEGQDGKMLGKDGAELMRMDAGPDEVSQPEIDRGQLRALLLGSLAPGTVRWGHGLDAVRPLGDGSHELVFTGGTTTVADLVVGADGAWSTVRPLVSAASPTYTGVTFVELAHSDVDERLPGVAALVGRGSMFALAEDKGLIAQRNSGGHVRTYAALRVPEPWVEASGVDWTDPVAARAALADLFAGWAPELLSLIATCDDLVVPRKLRMLPARHMWPTRPGVTLLGDAAHLMSPFGGQGANYAMLDGAELAAAIADHPDLDAAVRAYEAAMHPRAQEAARGAAQGLDVAIAADAPAGPLAFFGGDH